MNIQTFPEIYIYCLRSGPVSCGRATIKGKVIVFKVFLILKSVFFFFSFSRLFHIYSRIYDAIVFCTTSLFYAVKGFPSLFIVCDRLCLILKCTVGSFQALWLLFCIHSFSQVQVGPLSAVPRHPLVPPAALTATLTVSLLARTDNFIQDQRDEESLKRVWKCWISFWLLHKFDCTRCFSPDFWVSQGQRFEMKTQVSGFKMKDKGVFSWVALKWIHFS